MLFVWRLFMEKKPTKQTKTSNPQLKLFSFKLWMFWLHLEHVQEVAGDGQHYTCFLIHFKNFSGYFFIGGFSNCITRELMDCTVSGEK